MTAMIVGGTGFAAVASADITKSGDFNLGEGFVELVGCMGFLLLVG
jgi:hypothetical protein